MKRERGQERDTRRTVDKRSPGSRPRIRKEEASGASGRGNKVIRTGIAYPDEIVKARKKVDIPPPSGLKKRIGKSKPEVTKEKSVVPRRAFKERTSDVFRREVINKPSPKRFEEVETGSSPS